MTKQTNPPSRQEALNSRLYIAVNGYLLDDIRRLLAEGADPNYSKGKEECVLSFAAAYTTPAIVQTLIDHGAVVDVCDSEGLTPLARALETAEFDNARVLLRNGANLSHQEVAGVTAPPFAVAILADILQNTTVRTEFVLEHAPDLAASFDISPLAPWLPDGIVDLKHCVLGDFLALMMIAGEKEYRAVVQAICERVDQAAKARQQAQEDAQMKKLSTDRRRALYGKKDGRFKL